MHPDIPRAAVMLLDFIGNTEAPRGYGVIYRNRQNLLARPLTEMTLGEVLVAQPGWTTGNGSSAAGRYQVIEATLTSVIDQLSLDLDLPFDADLQDRIGLALLRRRGFDGFVSGKVSLADFGLELAREWAAFPVLLPMQGAHRWISPGETYYAGDALNRALITAPAFITMLEQCLAVARDANVDRTHPAAPGSTGWRLP